MTDSLFEGVPRETRAVLEGIRMRTNHPLALEWLNVLEARLQDASDVLKPISLGATPDPQEISDAQQRVVNARSYLAMEAYPDA
jgi:hypothetical protein